MPSSPSRFLKFLTHAKAWVMSSRPLVPGLASSKTHLNSSRLSPSTTLFTTRPFRLILQLLRPTGMLVFSSSQVSILPIFLRSVLDLLLSPKRLSIFLPSISFQTSLLVSSMDSLETTISMIFRDAWRTSAHSSKMLRTSFLISPTEKSLKLSRMLVMSFGCSQTLSKDVTTPMSTKTFRLLRSGPPSSLNHPN